jgi:hypothetical protein
MRLILTTTLSALMLCAPALAQTAPEADESYSRIPTSVGDPDTVYCRRSEAVGSSRLGPVCRTSAEWARYPKYGIDAFRNFLPGFTYMSGTNVDTGTPQLSQPVLNNTP